MKRKRSRVFLLYGLVLMLGGLFSLTLYFFILKPPGSVTAPGREKRFSPERPDKREVPRPRPFMPDPTRPKVAIIIDDLGYDLKVAKAFMRMGLPLTLSILPLAPFTKNIAHEAKMRGLEILLHQPMEPGGYPRVDPGPGALLLSMSPIQIVGVLDANLKQIPGVKGINNHMGSSFTMNRDKMGVVAKVLREERLFFIDSRTSKGTVALEEMGRHRVPGRSRDVFLDNELASHAIDGQIARLLCVAEREGSAIGIGHPHPMTLERLMKNRERLHKRARMVPVSELMGPSYNLRKNKGLPSKQVRR